MSLKVIGAGIGRTGTMSLRIALNTLGFGPCYHMEDVARDLPGKVPQWNAALAGQADWEAIYDGYNSAVDWPTARFFRELHAKYPEAKFILGVRSPESWAASFGETILKLVNSGDDAPEQFHDWLAMCRVMIPQCGVPLDADDATLRAAFTAHVNAVKVAIAPDKLLVYEIKDGWAPICAFLGVPVPDEPFPRTNDRGEFWDLIASVA